MREASDRGAVVVYIGNMHTFAASLQGVEIMGVLGHKSGGPTAGKLRWLVFELPAGRLDGPTLRAEHESDGAAISSRYNALPTFESVAATGPGRGLVAASGWNFAAPHGASPKPRSQSWANPYLPRSE